MASNTYPPTADALFRAWVLSHSATWEDATTIGLSATQRTSYVTNAADFEKKWQQYVAAQNALRDARDEWRAAKSDMRSETMEDLGIIRRFALTQPSPSVTYNAADIPAPKIPVDGVPPGQPVEIKATLNTTNGNLKLTWKCNNPGTTTGTVYILQRRAGTSGAWTQAGISSARSFTDVTVPSSPVVQYQITAQRSGISGLTSQPVNIAFGHGPAGEVFVTSVKMAA